VAALGQGSTVVIEQPSYVPWLGYFDLMARADTWVWYDDVDYTRADWRNRNRLARAGPASWVTVPVRARRGTRIVEVEIDQGRSWQRKHLETLRHCCGAAPHYEATARLFRSFLERQHRYLADLVIELNETIAAELGIRARFLRSSRLSCGAGRKQQRLLDICGDLGATTYLSGPRARAYLEPPAFQSRGLELRYLDYEPMLYQRGNLPFVDRLSILDPLSWHGGEGTARLLPGLASKEGPPQ
jgi:hypothetical protein